MESSRPIIMGVAISWSEYSAMLAEFDRLRKIEAAAKALTDAWQRGDHEQDIIDAVAKLTKAVTP